MSGDRGAHRLRREPPTFRLVEVEATEVLTPHLIRITFAGDDLAGFSVEEPAASIRLLLPPRPGDGLEMPMWNGNEFLLADGARPLLRTYTPRRWDAERLRLDVDVVLHPGGAAAAWAAAAEPGARAAISGPGRGYAVDPSATQMLLAGDETAVPAIAQLLEVIPGSVIVSVLIELARPDARLELPGHPRATTRWLDLPPGAAPGAALVDAVRSTQIAPDASVWAAGEAASMQRIRRHLFDEVGLSRAQATVRGYWKVGRTSHD